MFVTLIENFILFATAFALLGFLFAAAARRMTVCGRWRLHPHTLARLYAATVALPPAAALWLVAAAMLPEIWLTTNGFDAAHSAPHHELHLLSDITAMLEPKLAYATLLFAFAASLFAAWSGVRSYHRVGQLLGKLKMNAAAPPPPQVALVERIAARGNLDVGLVLSAYPLSFVWGYTRSKLVLSSGLLRALNPEELACVVEHEAAHHRRRDNWVKLTLSICGYASLAFPLARLALRWRAEQVELVCDEVAAAATAAPLEVASALVKLRRTFAQAAPLQTATQPAGASGFISAEETEFERRVLRLVRLADAPPAHARAARLSRSPKAPTLFVAALFAATLVAAVCGAPLAVHRVAESVIQLIN